MSRFSQVDIRIPMMPGLPGPPRPSTYCSTPIINRFPRYPPMNPAYPPWQLPVLGAYVQPNFRAPYPSLQSHEFCHLCPETHMLIPSDVIPYIIGPKGAVIKSLEQQSGVGLRILDSSHSESKLQVMEFHAAPGSKELNKARCLIVHKIQEKIPNWTPFDPVLGHIDLPTNNVSRNSDKQFGALGEDNYLMVPSPIVGYIVGPKGETIKKIEQESGARIDVMDKTDDDVLYQVIQIRAPQHSDELNIARRIIIEKVRDRIPKWTPPTEKKGTKRKANSTNPSASKVARFDSFLTENYATPPAYSQYPTTNYTTTEIRYQSHITNVPNSNHFDFNMLIDCLHSALIWSDYYRQAGMTYFSSHIDQVLQYYACLSKLKEEDISPTLDPSQANASSSDINLEDEPFQANDRPGDEKPMIDLDQVSEPLDDALPITDPNQDREMLENIQPIADTPVSLESSDSQSKNRSIQACTSNPSPSHPGSEFDEVNN